VRCLTTLRLICPLSNKAYQKQVPFSTIFLQEYLLCEEVAFFQWVQLS